MAASDAELRRPVPRGEVGERREHRHCVSAGQVVAGEAERLVGARARLRHRVVEDVGVVGVPVLRFGAAPRDGGAEGVQRERGAEHGAVAQQRLEQRMVDELGARKRRRQQHLAAVVGALGADRMLVEAFAVRRCPGGGDAPAELAAHEPLKLAAHVAEHLRRKRAADDQQLALGEDVDRGREVKGRAVKLARRAVGVDGRAPRELQAVDGGSREGGEGGHGVYSCVELILACRIADGDELMVHESALKV